MPLKLVYVLSGKVSLWRKPFKIWKEYTLIYIKFCIVRQWFIAKKTLCMLSFVLSGNGAGTLVCQNSPFTTSEYKDDIIMIMLPMMVMMLMIIGNITMKLKLMQTIAMDERELVMYNNIFPKLQVKCIFLLLFHVFYDIVFVHIKQHLSKTTGYKILYMYIKRWVIHHKMKHF